MYLTLGLSPISVPSSTTVGPSLPLAQRRLGRRGRAPNKRNEEPPQSGSVQGVQFPKIFADVRDVLVASTLCMVYGALPRFWYSKLKWSMWIRPHKVTRSISHTRTDWYNWWRMAVAAINHDFKGCQGFITRGGVSPCQSKLVHCLGRPGKLQNPWHPWQLWLNIRRIDSLFVVPNCSSRGSKCCDSSLPGTSGTSSTPSLLQWLGAAWVDGRMWCWDRPQLHVWGLSWKLMAAGLKICSIGGVDESSPPQKKKLNTSENWKWWQTNDDKCLQFSIQKKHLTGIPWAQRPPWGPSVTLSKSLAVFGEPQGKSEDLSRGNVSIPSH